MDYCKRTWLGDVEVKKMDAQNTSIVIRDTVAQTSSTILVGAHSVLDFCASHNYVVYCNDEEKIHVVRLDDFKENFGASISDLKLVASTLNFDTRKMTAEEVELVAANLKIGSSKYASRPDTVVPTVLLTSTDSSVFLVVNNNGVSSIKRLFTEAELCDVRNWRPTVIQCESDILIKQAVSGHAHSVFLTDKEPSTHWELEDSDDVYVWGWNHMGQLGPDKQSSEYAPIPLELDDTIQSIEAFNNWTCVTTNKEVVVYGTVAIGKPSDEVKLNL